ncbi:MAG: glycosyltransferase [Candidatus Tagabacteria bacterium]
MLILSNKDYLPAFPWLKKSKLKIIYPAINHLSEKNRFINEDIAKEIILGQGINSLKPIVAQVSRFDFWKDPLGVIRAYYLAKNEIPDLQLVLVGFFETQDDPEQVLVFEQVKKHVRGDPNIYLFLNQKQLKNVSMSLFINALRTLNRIILQGSIREGFGLTITEGMWKGQPVIARISSGALIQIKNGENGILVASPEEMGKAISRLLKNEKLREKIGKAARESVRKNFLMPRFILNNLKLYKMSNTRCLTEHFF